MWQNTIIRGIIIFLYSICSTLSIRCFVSEDVQLSGINCNILWHILWLINLLFLLFSKNSFRHIRSAHPCTSAASFALKELSYEVAVCSARHFRVRFWLWRNYRNYREILLLHFNGKVNQCAWFFVSSQRSNPGINSFPAHCWTLSCAWV